MNAFSAIRPGTDLSSYARELVRMHDSVIGGRRSVLAPRPVVQRSWGRVLGQGLAADQANHRRLIAFDEIERRRRESPLNSVVEDLRHLIAAVADASQLLFVMTDADGVILWRDGSVRVRRQADSLGFIEGAVWTESAVGTNAIGTAIAEASPVQLFSGEHFEQAQHPWYCTAAPIHDPRTGDLLGIVDLSGPALTLHPTITALVETSVRLAESQLWRHHQSRLEQLRSTAAPVLAGSHGPVLLVDDHGWVAHATGIAADRIAVPRPDRALSIPGLGLCMPERIVNGWIVRPAGADSRVRMTLDVQTSTIEVDGAWRTALTARHVQILRLLHRGSLTAAQLSNALFGDDDHVVSARAEVSRLRRILGAFVETKPYRLAHNVELTVLS